MARWQERTRGPNWLVDESGRLLGYKDADGDVHTIPSGPTGLKVADDSLEASTLTADDAAKLKATRPWVQKRPTSLHPSPPAVSVSATDPIVGGLQQLPWGKAARIVNAAPSFDAANVRINTSSGSMPGVHFATAADRVTLAWVCQQPNKERIAVWVDGRPLWDSARSPRADMLDTGSAVVSTSAGATYFLTLTFAAAGHRVIEMQVATAVGFQYLKVPLGHGLQAAPPRPTVMILSDSFHAGSAAVTNTEDLPACRLALGYECSVINNSVASSGYVAGTVFATQSRVNHAAISQPDLIIPWGSVNDGAGLTADAVLSTWDAYAAVAPKARFVVFGPPPSNATDTLGAVRTANNRLLRECASLRSYVDTYVDQVGTSGDPVAAYADGVLVQPGELRSSLGSIWAHDSTGTYTTTNPTRPGQSRRWSLVTALGYYGTGNTGSVAGDGSRDVLLHSDNIHPAVAGLSGMYMGIASVLDSVSSTSA